MQTIEQELSEAWTHLRELASDDDASARELADLLVLSLDKWRTGLRAASRGGSPVELARQAQGLRSTALTAGLTAIGTLARSIATGEVAGADTEAAVDRLVARTDSVIAAMQPAPDTTH